MPVSGSGNVQRPGMGSIQPPSPPQVQPVQPPPAPPTPPPTLQTADTSKVPGNFKLHQKNYEFACVYFNMGRNRNLELIIFVELFACVDCARASNAYCHNFDKAFQ